MKKLLLFLRTTFVGGLLFLVPVVVVVVVVDKAVNLAHKLIDPLTAHIPIDSVVGLRTPVLLAVAVVIAFCFLAGLFAQTALARKIVMGLEDTVLSKLPGYALLKSVTHSMLGADEQGAFQTVFVRFDDAWQLGFQVGASENGFVTVFISDAPNPQSGSIYFVTADRIKPAGIPLSAALKSLKSAGVGLGTHLRGVTPPAP